MIPFALPDITKSEMEAAAKAVESGWLSTGPEALYFEEELRMEVNAADMVLVNSATSGMQLVIEELLGTYSQSEAPTKREIVIPAITFVSDVETVVRAGGLPVVCDVCPKTQNMRLCDLQAVTTLRTAAVVLVHFGGAVPAEYDQIVDWCAREGIQVIEDAAHSFGAFYSNGMPVGAARTYATIFSFYATKNIACGDGGAIACGHELAAKLRKTRMHGISRDVFDRYRTPGKWEYDVTEIGSKANLPDPLAAIGRVQLRRHRSMLDQRKRIAERYRFSLRDCGIQLPEKNPDSAWHLYPVQLPSHVDRNKFIEDMAYHGVGCSVHFKPLHRLSAYRFPVQPNAEAYWQRAVSLPIYSKLKELEVDKIIRAVITCLTLTSSPA